MDVYCVAFTFPRPPPPASPGSRTSPRAPPAPSAAPASGAAASAPASGVHAPSASPASTPLHPSLAAASVEQTRSALAVLGLGPRAPDDDDPPREPRSSNLSSLPTRVNSGFSSMRSRLAARAFMPAAFGALKRSQDNIPEAVSPAHDDAEDDAHPPLASAAEHLADGSPARLLPDLAGEPVDRTRATRSPLAADRAPGGASARRPLGSTPLKHSGNSSSSLPQAPPAAPPTSAGTTQDTPPPENSTPASTPAAAAAPQMSQQAGKESQMSQDSAPTESEADFASVRELSPALGRAVAQDEPIDDTGPPAANVQCVPTSRSAKSALSTRAPSKMTPSTSVTDQNSPSVSTQSGSPIKPVPRPAQHKHSKSHDPATILSKAVDRLASVVGSAYQCRVSAMEVQPHPHLNLLSLGSNAKVLAIVRPTGGIGSTSATEPVVANGTLQPGGYNLAPASQSGTSMPSLLAFPSALNSSQTSLPASIKSLHSLHPVTSATRTGMALLEPDLALASTALGSVSFPSSETESDPAKYCFLLSGSFQQVFGAKGAVLRQHPFPLTKRVKCPLSDLVCPATDPGMAPSVPAGTGPDGQPVVLRPDVAQRLEGIATSCRALVAIAHEAGEEVGPGLWTEQMATLVVAGQHDAVDMAKLQILVLLDELTGLQSEAYKLDFKLHNIVGGRKRSVIQQIQEETATNIYFPSSFSGVFGHAEQLDVAAHQSTVYITGDSVNVQRAKDMLHQLSVLKHKALLSREMAILPRKLDWMLTEHLDTVHAIAHDNGTTVVFPVVGSQASALVVLGDNRVAVERTTRALMALAAQFYTASIWLLPMGYDVFAVQQALTLQHVAPALRLVSVQSGAEVLFKSNCFEVHGLETEVRTAVALLLDLELVRPFNYEVRFQIELANEHRDFISGKKNGKMNKIMKAANVRIKFETFNEYNFRIDVSSTDKNSVLHGLALLQEELPAETSFHVPEVYHKRIIGVGGKNIQRIMKKFGVYVKFSNADEFASLGGYHDNSDNVVARTPAKNKMALTRLKTAVMELVPPQERDWATSSLPVPRRYHRTLLGDKSIFVHDIESRTGTALCVPPREDASDSIFLVGPAAQRPIAARMLLAHVPTSATFVVPATAALVAAITSSQAGDADALAESNSVASPPTDADAGRTFTALLDTLRTQLSVNTVPPVLDADLLSHPRATFHLFTAAASADNLPAAKEMIINFLIAREVPVYVPSKSAADAQGEERTESPPLHTRTDSILSSAHPESFASAYDLASPPGRDSFSAALVQDLVPHLSENSSPHQPAPSALSHTPPAPRSAELPMAILDPSSAHSSAHLPAYGSGFGVPPTRDLPPGPSPVRNEYGSPYTYAPWGSASDVWGPPTGSQPPRASADMWSASPQDLWGAREWNGSSSNLLRRGSHLSFYPPAGSPVFSTSVQDLAPGSDWIGAEEQEAVQPAPPRSLGVRAQSMDFGYYPVPAQPRRGLVRPQQLYARGNPSNASIQSVASLHSLASGAPSITHSEWGVPKQGSYRGNMDAASASALSLPPLPSLYRAGNRGQWDPTASTAGPAGSGPAGTPGPRVNHTPSFSGWPNVHLPNL